MLKCAREIRSCQLVKIPIARLTISLEIVRLQREEVGRKLFNCLFFYQLGEDCLAIPVTLSHQTLGWPASSCSEAHMKRCAFCSRRFVNSNRIRAHSSSCSPLDLV